MSDYPFSVSYRHRVVFTEDTFACENTVLVDAALDEQDPTRVVKLLAFVDQALLRSHEDLPERLQAYCEHHAAHLKMALAPVLIPGGEVCKNDFKWVERCWAAINEANLDRHSVVLIIGGGAVLDMVGFAASTAHRGIRHLRMPTTTLSQADGGVGVKNGVNYFGKKNWVGSFNVPDAVINDFRFIDSLPTRQKRCGLIEALKVALIRDAEFYAWIQENALKLGALASTELAYLIQRSAQLHVDHIVGNGDPFERGSARPLDFGHWAAHKLEQISGFEIAHGEAVAIGMALDVLYSVNQGILDAKIADDIIDLIEQLGFALYSPYLSAKQTGGEPVVLAGLEEFREHLGGELTVTLVPKIGEKLEVHEMNSDAIMAAVAALQQRSKFNESTQD